MSARRTRPSRRDDKRPARAKRPESSPPRGSSRPPSPGASGGAVKEEVSRPGSRLQGKADEESPEPGALRPLARALIELAVALRRENENENEDEDKKGARE